jgi:hypothetical protein
MKAASFWLLSAPLRMTAKKYSASLLELAGTVCPDSYRDAQIIQPFLSSPTILYGNN